MTVHRILIGVEGLLLVFPMLLLSGFWILIAINGLIETGVDQFPNSLIMLLHVIIALLSLFAVSSLMYGSAYFVVMGSVNKMISRSVVIKLIITGVAISSVGVVAMLYNIALKLHGDPLQMFMTYVCGVVLWIPAAHLLLMIRAKNR